jgi:hypothetical protein
MRKITKEGNSFFSKKKPLPEAAINTSQFWKINSFIIGIQRVACPKPQSKGATNIRVF